MSLIDLTHFQDNEKFDEFLISLCNTLGFDYAAYATTSRLPGDIHGFTTYSPEWERHYVEHDLQRLDPTLAMAAQSIAPVDWKRLRHFDSFHRVFSDAHDFGISDKGLSIPIRGPFGDFGLMSVTRDCTDTEWEKFLPEVVGELQHAAVHLHDNVLRSGVLPKSLERPSLSARELEIIQWVAAGKSQQDIGDILSISHRTVEVHIRSSREKLGALTTAQAVGRAISLGMIQPG